MIQKIINLSGLIKNHFLRKFYSWKLAKYVDDGAGKILLHTFSVPIVIKKKKNSKFILDGNLRIVSSLYGVSPIRIILEENSIFHLKGDFTIGNGVCLSLSKGATLSIGGKFAESDSGITADSTIMVYKNITIGRDFVCAWGVFISDSNWHRIEHQYHQEDVVIGDHVWIANNTNILKGSLIGDNCIVASNSKVINSVFLPHCMIAGIPAKVVKTDINWFRDI